MLDCLRKECPQEVEITNPKGGMFLWLTLPQGVSSNYLFKMTSKQNVAFVPGSPFYVDEEDTNTLRMNYTNSSIEEIEIGVKVLADCLKKMM